MLAVNIKYKPALELEGFIARFVFDMMPLKQELTVVWQPELHKLVPLKATWLIILILDISVNI